MLHDLYQIEAKPTRPKEGPYPTSNSEKAYEKEQRNKKEAKAEKKLNK